MTQPLIIAIDGPAGAGKSTVTKQVAQRLGMLYLDTGAMYRAATVAVLDAAVDLDDATAISRVVQQADINFNAEGVICLGTAAQEPRIRSSEITNQIWRVADNPDCRSYLVKLQQQIVAGRDAALEGRDATTVICPHAGLKIYLDASPEERARRRLLDWSDETQPPALAEVARQITERDQRDQQREVGALTLSDDAVHLVTDGLQPNEVIARIIALAVQRRPLLLEALVADQVVIGRSREAGYVKVLSGNLAEPPGPWQLGLTNPSPERLPNGTKYFNRNNGGRQAGVLCQGRAVLVLAGRDDTPSAVVALPMLPQSWYIIEPGCWHAVVQTPGTICAWAESSTITEQQAAIDPTTQAEMQQFLQTYLPSELL